MQLTDEFMLSAKEALPFDLENGRVGTISFFSVRIVFSSGKDGTSIEVRFASDATIINVPVLPSQNSTAPEIF